MLRYINFFMIQPTPIYFMFFTGVAFGIICLMPMTYSNWSMFLFIAPTAWTFQEYLIHRYIMHGSFITIKKAHFKHHEKPSDKNKIFIPIILTLFFSLLNGILLWFFGNKWLTLLNLASNVLCYHSFEWVHYNCHLTYFTKKHNYIINGPRKFHLLHHSYNPEGKTQHNFGFTSATWDIVFGTCDDNTKKSAWLSILLVPIPVLPLICHNYVNTNYNKNYNKNHNTN